MSRQTTGSPALTAGDAISLPALMTICEVGRLVGYKHKRTTRNWLDRNCIAPHRKGDDKEKRIWPRASIVRALGTLPPNVGAAK